MLSELKKIIDRNSIETNVEEVEQSYLDLLATVRNSLSNDVTENMVKQDYVKVMTKIKELQYVDGVLRDYLHNDIIGFTYIEGIDYPDIYDEDLYEDEDDDDDFDELDDLSDMSIEELEEMLGEMSK